MLFSLGAEVKCLGVFLLVSEVAVVAVLATVATLTLHGISDRLSIVTHIGQYLLIVLGCGTTR